MINYPCPHGVTKYCGVCEFKEQYMNNKEPKLPDRVVHGLGIYFRDNSDLFIDDLTPEELRQIADHLEWTRENNK